VFINQPMTCEAWDYFRLLWPPAIILGLASRPQCAIMRTAMLDE